MTKAEEKPRPAEKGRIERYVCMDDCMEGHPCIVTYYTPSYAARGGTPAFQPQCCVSTYRVVSWRRMA